MEAKAIARHVRVTPRKARRMVDLIRGKKATEAITILKFAPQDASLPVRKVLESAIANARVKADKAGEPFRENDLVRQGDLCGRRRDAQAFPRSCTGPCRSYQQAHQPHHGRRR